MLDALFDQKALLFTVPALLGTAVFLLKLILMALGGFGAATDGPPDIDAPDVAADAAHTDSTQAFKFMSVQSVAAFLMGFGWGGLGGVVGFDWGLPASLLLAVGFGAALVWLLGIVMKAVYDLESSGNIGAHDAAGAEGSVYAGVPARGAGRGQVRVIIGDRERIYSAVSEGDALPTGTRIRVVRANDDRTVTVAAI